MNFLFAVVAYAGIAYYQSWEPLIGRVNEGAPAAEAGFRPGDLVTAVDGQALERWRQFQDYVAQRPGREVVFQVRRDGEEVELPTEIARVVAVVDSASGDTMFYGQIGVYVDTENAERTLGPVGAAAVGWGQTLEMSALVLEFVGRLVTGRASARDIGGPILIGQLSGRAARAGAMALIGFMAILSVHLAILNLLPIPILDGGHLVFLAIEGVRGRALSLETRARLSQVGFFLILALMVWALTSDVLRATGN